MMSMELVDEDHDGTGDIAYLLRDGPSMRELLLPPDLAYTTHLPAGQRVVVLGVPVPAGAGPAGAVLVSSITPVALTAATVAAAMPQAARTQARSLVDVMQVGGGMRVVGSVG